MFSANVRRVLAGQNRSLQGNISLQPVQAPLLQFGQVVRSLFIQTESTPNPESIKFLPGKTVLDVEEGGEVGNGFYCTRQDKDEIARSPLAKLIFAVEGVKSVYLGQDFVTVTKYAEVSFFLIALHDFRVHIMITNPISALLSRFMITLLYGIHAGHLSSCLDCFCAFLCQGSWGHIRTPVFGAIMDHYASGKPALSAVAEVTDTTIFDDDSEVVALVKEILEARIRPAVQEDGGDIRYVDYDEETGIVKVRLAGSCVGCPSSSVTLKNGVENMLMHYIEEVTAVEAIEDESDDGNNSADVMVEQTKSGDSSNDEDKKKMKTYEERLAAAGIPFSD
uniref:Scaffold protein Nfu/NifU N-terminal domain-containing protein n=1 Tax=Pseudictyota dubia TaxID=2749911 RepID=A0A7R9WB08_9STRA|mmetsp:Transcript_40279/g.74522  ORF Transcript_40279/g.74522 Transcript_40279/m.74522 type:complete len:336 (+) Transcript_40279:257-1264(+)